MSIGWIEHQGRKILYQDYRNLSAQEMLTQADKAVELAEKIPGTLLVLIDVRDTFLNCAFMKKIKLVAQELRTQDIKSAILGITGAKTILFNAFNTLIRRPSQAFPDEATAKDYLAGV